MRKGFTLIELLVVIAIISLLSTLAVVAHHAARCRSGEAKAETCATENLPKDKLKKMTDAERCDDYKTDTNPPPFCLKVWGIEGK